MKTNKSIFAFTVILAACNAIFANESADQNTSRLTNQQESIIAEVATTVAESVITAIGNAIEIAQTQHKISLEQAHTLLQNLMNNLVEGSTFEINDIKYIVTANKTMTQENQE